MSPSLSILVVDDNEAAAQGMQKLLTLRGHKVEMAFTGQGALETVQAAQPQVVMLDIGLPDMTGHEVAKQLRTQQNYAGTLIALTGYGQDDDKDRSHAAGFDHHLTKPAALAEIEAILNTLF